MFRAKLSVFCKFLHRICYFYLNTKILVVNAHNTDTVGTFVFDEQSNSIV